MSKGIIAVDVDMTVVNPVTKWVMWYQKKTGHTITAQEISEIQYNVNDMMHKHHDPLSFWRQCDLYDDLYPIKNSVETLSKLHEMGYTIIFVSSCFPEHQESKTYFLKRFFPFHSGFIDTDSKEFIRCDYFIDDYKKYLDKVRKGAEAFCIQHESPFCQEGDGYPIMNWEQISEFFEGEK